MGQMRVKSWRSAPLFAVAIVVVACLCLSSALAQTSVSARFLHIAAGNPAIDIYVNDALAIAELGYGQSYEHINLPAGPVELAAYVAGTSLRMAQETLDLAADAAIALRAGDGLHFARLADDLSPLEFGDTRFSVYNALADGSAIDIISQADGRVLGENIAAGETAGPFETGASVQDFAILPATEAADADRPLLEFSAALAGGTSNILALHGSAAQPQVLKSSATVAGVGEYSLLHFAHVAPDVAPIDLWLDSQLLVPALSFAQPSARIAIPSGTYRLTLRLGRIELAEAALDLQAGQMQTVLVLGSPATLNIAVYSDSSQHLAEDAAVVRLINTIAGSVVNSLQLDSGAIVAVDLEYSQAGRSVKIVPGRQAMSLDISIGDYSGTIAVPARHYYGGVYYTLLALPGDSFSAPQLLSVETVLQRHLRAAPPALESRPPAAARPTEAAPTAAPLSASATETVPTPSPVETRIPTGAGGAYFGLGPYAIVDLDPGANLQLRQYPSSAAMSLELLPAGSELMILGRRGPTEYWAGDPTDLPVDLSDFTSDPAATLYPIEDLRPADTWLYVMYKTDASGTLYGWVYAFYLQIFDEMRRQEQRLRDLPPVRQNQAGRALQLEPASARRAKRIAARVHGLVADAFLYIRSANDAQSQALGSLAPGTVLELVGFDAAEDWAFVRQETSTGEVISGWVSADYIQVLLNGDPIRLNVLRALDATAVELVSASARGSITQASDSAG